VDWRFEAEPPQARGVIADFEGVRYERTVYFDPPFVVVVDNYGASDPKRFGAVFHGEGELEFLNATADSDAAKNPPFDMPPVRTAGEGYKMLTDRRVALVDEQLHARWTLADGWKLEARICGDGPFEATQARSPGNPFPAERGALLLRAPGSARTLVSVYELHQGESKMSKVDLADGAVQVTRTDGSVKTYAWAED